MRPPPTLAAFRAQLATLEGSLRLELERVRAALEHGGNKGALAEKAFRKGLMGYLPRRLAMGHGEVIDAYDNRSAQCDLVIVTDHHPHWYTTDEPSLFLVEAVAAAGEVKAVLTSDELATALANMRRFRQLRPRWGPYTETVGSPEDIQRYYRNPPTSCSPTNRN